MLYSLFVTFFFRRFCQSGFYFDFFYKKLAEIFIRNLYIYTAQFFGEKYVIEGWTKKVVEKCLFYLNKFIGWGGLKYFNFFLHLLVILFYSVSFFNIILILL